MNEETDLHVRFRPAAELATTGERATMRCAIYERSATTLGQEEDPASPTAQRPTCERYIASRGEDGWQALPTRYDDSGFTGASLDRPALQRLLNDCEEGRVDVVVVTSVDRLTRSLIEFAVLVERITKAGVVFVSVKGNLSTLDPAGGLALNMVLGFAELERERVGRTLGRG